MIFKLITCMLAVHHVARPSSLTTKIQIEPVLKEKYFLSHVVPSNKNVNNERTHEATTINRRRVVSFTLLLFGIKAPTANAAMENNQDIFKPGEALGVEAAKARLVAAEKSLAYLLDNYDEIAKGGGDNVRRYLGTVGTSSGMYGIKKVLKELQEEASDLVNYTETMLDFDYSLTAADTAVYSANFVEFSAAKTKPEKFFEDARTEAKKMQSYLKEMARELDIQ